MCLKLFPASCDIYVICNACDIYVVIWGPLYVKNKKNRICLVTLPVPGTRHTAK